MTSIRATVLALLAACIVPLAGAQARALYWPSYGYWWSDYRPPRHSHRHRQAEPAEKRKDQKPEAAAKGPLQLIISIPDQRISVYDNGALLAQSVVSTGVQEHPTPLGIFSVISKQRWHESNIYSAAPMPYMQRITWSGIALHAGVVPGHPASHGCIRLKNDFAIRLWHLTKRGTRVIIAPGETRPVEIAHARLFAAEPKVAAAPADVRAAVTDNIATTVVAANPPPSSDSGAQQVSDVQASGAMRTAAPPPRKPVPITVFVSRKSGKLSVRQAHAPLFDMPVTIKDPERPLGTHVFTVMKPPAEGEKPRWTVVSMPERTAPVPLPPQRHGRGKQTVHAAPAPSPDKAGAALDRVEIPPDAIERIAALLTPGSTFIVSDYGISPETGSDTDFIVETR